MPVPTPAQLGPLAALVGSWEGTKGLDVSFHNEDGAIGDTVYREKITFNPFGPVDNGDQHLYGLDYRMAAWRNDEPDPFHTEVGYWLWCSDSKQVMRCFMVPRGTVAIAGGTAEADAKTFTMTAELGSLNYGVLENKYLAENASTTKYEATITVTDADSWSYDTTTTLKMAKLGGKEMAHTDRNEMQRVAE